MMNGFPYVVFSRSGKVNLDITDKFEDILHQVNSHTLLICGIYPKNWINNENTKINCYYQDFYSK